MKRGTVVLVVLLTLILGGCGAEPSAETAPVPSQSQPTQSQPVDPVTLVKNGKMLDGLLTGGQPTDEQFAALRDAGYATVINLRMPDERGNRGEPETVAELGMAYVPIPVEGKAGLTEENAVALAAALETAEAPVLLHCGSGNRVGALLALKALHVDGKSPEEALEIGLAGGVTRLEPVVRELLGLSE